MSSVAVPKWSMIKETDRKGLVAILLGTDFVFNLAFYLVVPLLARHFVDSLGMAAWISGVVLGLRNLSQQGMFLFGGMLADRFGGKTVMVLGCILRALAFSGFAYFETSLLLGTCTALAGFAGALFTPAMKAMLAEAPDGEQAELFARSEVYQQLGAIGGPAIGVLLASQGFGTIAFVGAFVFLAWAIFLGITLPSSETKMKQVSSETAYNFGEYRTLIGIGLSATIYVAMFNQLYLCLPLSLAEQAPYHSSSVLFIAFGATIIIAYRPLRSLISQNKPYVSALGYTLMGFSWLLLLCVSGLSTTIVLVIHLGAASLLGLGSILVYPSIMASVAHASDDLSLPVAYGTFYLVAWGIGGTLTNALSGFVFDLSPTYIWLALLGASVWQVYRSLQNKMLVSV